MFSFSTASVTKAIAPVITPTAGIGNTLKSATTSLVYSSPSVKCSFTTSPPNVTLVPALSSHTPNLLDALKRPEYQLENIRKEAKTVSSDKTSTMNEDEEVKVIFMYWSCSS